MKKIALTVLAIPFIFSCSSPGNKETTTETAADAPVDAVEASESEEVLNPNFVSENDLYTLGMLDPEIQEIVNGRPYLDPIQYLEMLEKVVGESNYEKVKAKLFLPMNLNTTEEEDFKKVPGVGDKMAHEFEEYRPYTSIAQFRREIGKYVDEAEVARYEQYVFVPVNLNTASKEEILAIPGVGDRMLHEFEEYRPYESIEQFRREIGKYVDEDELARLERYVTL